MNNSSLPDTNIKVFETSPAAMPGLDAGISVVIPVYNSEKSLPLLVQRLQPVLQKLEARYELILVNDGSRDDSWAVVRNLVKQYPWILGINLMRNYGQHNALLCGLRAAKFNLVVTMDDDLQHPPEQIPRLHEEIKRGGDVVYGKPQREQHGLWRNVASQATKLAMQQMIGAETARDISSFRAFRTHLRNGFATFQGPFVSIDVLLTWSTTKFRTVEVQREPRKVGKSNYNFFKLLVHTTNVIVSFSTLPLRLATWVGLFVALCGLGILAYVVASYLLHGSVPGFTFLACIVSLFSGTQLFALGIMGEYLGRVFQRSMERPAYTVKEASVMHHNNK